MRKMAVLTITLAMVALASTVVAETPKVKTLYIKGYDFGKFAIVGPVQDSFDEVVGAIKKEQPPKTELHINLWGSADRTGPSAKNDLLSRERSEEAKRRFEIGFPEAKKENIVAVALGDYENDKQVRVEYWFSLTLPPPAAAKTTVITPANSKADDNHIVWILAMTAVVAAVLVIVLRKGRSQTLPVVTSHLDPATMNYGGKTFSVPLCSRADGHIWTPFWNPDNTGWIFRKERDLAVKAVRSFGKDAEKDRRRSRQIEKLVGDGTIKEIVVV